MHDDLRFYGGKTARRFLDGSESAIMDVVRDAYATYGAGDMTLPQSSFLRFANNPANRIIALPAFLGGGFNIAGIKWIASFPGNITQGMDRASAVLVLNNADTGRPLGFVEASSINAHRTAASAALAARMLSRVEQPQRCALVGCGYIGYQMLVYLKTTFPSLQEVLLIDKDAERGAYMKQRLQAYADDFEVIFDTDVQAIKQRRSQVVSFATSAGTPWLDDAAFFDPQVMVLHISLRDLSPAMILNANNIVDDAEHACREKTSLHLAQMECGHRDFVNVALPDLINAGKPLSLDEDKPIIFSPFGLGILDIAVGQWILNQARSTDEGIRITDFFPEQWGAEG
ncbi:MAG: 2,3-diaminopropionate biosynthesis protein SbnB [Wenzhouxiangellaceae bacterium]